MKELRATAAEAAVGTSVASRMLRTGEQPSGVIEMFRKSFFVAVLVGSAAASAAPARHFLEDAIKGDNSETSLGRLIASRGDSAQVRSFGRTLVRDHSRARVDAAAVANAITFEHPHQ